MPHADSTGLQTFANRTLCFEAFIARPQFGERLIEQEFKPPSSSFRHSRISDGIPPNTTATVNVPARDATKVTECGKPASKAPGIRFIRYENGTAVYETGSGAYRFESTDMGFSKD